MSYRRRILIAKQSSWGLSAILNGLDPRRTEVIAFCDASPLMEERFGEIEIDICLIDLQMLRRVLKSHPNFISRIRRSGAVALILGGKHIAKARQFSDKVDGFVLVDGMLGFINESLMLARDRHCLLPAGMLSSLAVLNMRLESLATLSPAEQTILAHLAAARTNQVIAARMTISEATVKALVRSVLTKLGLLNRTEAAIFAASQNLSLETTSTGAGFAASHRG